MSGRGGERREQATISRLKWRWRARLYRLHFAMRLLLMHAHLAEIHIDLVNPAGHILLRLDDGFHRRLDP